MMNKIKLTQFQDEPITFVETIHIKEGVVCDVYHYDSDQTKDLAIVTVAPGSATPKQKVLEGEKTIEGYIAGSGTFIFNGVEHVTESAAEFTVYVDNLMQWVAGPDGLTFYKICYPPYKDGRYQNLPD